MSNTNFQDISGGSKVLIIIEFLLFSAVVIGVYQANNNLGFIQQTDIPFTVVSIYATIFALTTQLAMLSMGLYNPKLRENFRTIFKRLALSYTIAYLVFMVSSTVTDLYSIQAELAAIASLVGLVATSCLRLLTEKVNFLGMGKRRILIVGSGERASIIEKRMRRDVDRQSFDLLGFITMPGDSDDAMTRETKIDLKGESLVSYAMRHKADEIVVACDERRGNLPTEELFSCKIRGINIIEILDFIERETGQVAVNLIYPSWVIYSNGFSSTNYLRNSLDYLLNAMLALLVMTFALPIMLIASIAIKLDDGWKSPIFYLQVRLGLDGKPFKIIKFRSMREDAEKDGAKWAAKDDDRTTRIGGFLRKYRVDELPQLWNVLKGDMGFVGPRPERPEFIHELAQSIPYYRQRLNVKPGLTGWAQLKYPYGSTVEDARQKLHYDLYYIKHRSILLDFHILIRTAEVVLFGKGR